MALSSKNFDQLTGEIVTNIQGFATTLVDLTVGSVLLAVVEATSAVVMWLQGLILALLATTRAATSTGADLDSWAADYGFYRLAATFATGSVTFSRFTPTQQAVVPVGAIVQTADGTQQYSVNLDTANPAYNAGLGGYVIVAGATSVTVAVTALTAGTAANVISGGISAIAQAISGVDTVTNGQAFTNGDAIESDASFRTRFLAYIASLSKATLAAIKYAITSLQQGVSYSITENQQKNGQTDNGYFYAIVDDGTGAPSETFITSEAAAIEAVRPIGIRYGVFGPTDVTANITMTIVVASGYVHGTVATAVLAALETYINTLGVGVPLPYTMIASTAYNAVPGAISNVSSVLLNGGTVDLPATAQQVVRAGSITIS
jgi:uncharacterized phage protein gp47/JayE